MKPQPMPRALPVYDIPPHELAYWDALDTRVTCDGCRYRSDNYCRATPGKPATIFPPQLKHRCSQWRKAR